MITSKLVSPDGKVFEQFKTGYNSLKEAAKALQSDWQIVRLDVSNVIILGDYDDCRLILQERKA